MHLLTLVVKLCKITLFLFCFFNKKQKKGLKHQCNDIISCFSLNFQPWKQRAAIGCRACRAAAGAAGLEAAVVCADVKRAPRAGSSAVSNRVISKTMSVPWCHWGRDELPGSQAVEVGDLWGGEGFDFFFLFPTHGSIFDQEVALSLTFAGFAAWFANPALFILLPYRLCVFAGGRQRGDQVSHQRWVFPQCAAAGSAFKPHKLQFYIDENSLAEQRNWAAAS